MGEAVRQLRIAHQVDEKNCDLNHRFTDSYMHLLDSAMGYARPNITPKQAMQPITFGKASYDAVESCLQETNLGALVGTDIRSHVGRTRLPPSR